MTSKNLALLTGVSCVVVLATYAWAASQEAEVKVEDAAAEVTETAEPARLCIPMAEANDATAVVEETDEAKSEEATEDAKTDDAATEEASEDGAAEALPICDEDGNPPAPEGETAEGEAAEGEAAEEATEEKAEAAEKTE